MGMLSVRPVAEHRGWKRIRGLDDSGLKYYRYFYLYFIFRILLDGFGCITGG